MMGEQVVQVADQLPADEEDERVETPPEGPTQNNFLYCRTKSVTDDYEHLDLVLGSREIFAYSPTDMERAAETLKSHARLRRQGELEERLRRIEEHLRLDVSEWYFQDWPPARAGWPPLTHT